MHYRKPRNRGLALAATAALAAGGIVAETSSAKTTPARPAGRTVHVIEHAITDTEIPTRGGKDVKGNILTFNNPVYNSQTRNRSGTTRASAPESPRRRGSGRCLWTTFLNAGQITVQGP